MPQILHFNMLWSGSQGAKQAGGPAWGTDVDNELQLNEAKVKAAMAQQARQDREMELDERKRGYNSLRDAQVCLGIPWYLSSPPAAAMPWPLEQHWFRHLMCAALFWAPVLQIMQIESLPHQWCCRLQW